jgi:1-acyl-sn-glycerol-3-phosphate acyltransferase
MGLRMLPTMDATYVLARNALYLPLRYGIQWTIEGAQVIPVRGPVILASNHVSYLDPLVLAYLADRRHRRVRFLAKAELFEKGLLGPLLRGAHQIPVRRGSADASASLDAAVEALHRGECVTVFPEGTISLDLDPMAGKSGTARLAQESGVPVTPVGLWGMQRVLFKGRKPNWKTGVAEVVTVGNPIRIAPEEDVREATDRIMSAICAQVRRARELYPQLPEAGDDGWWVRPPETARLRTCRAPAGAE